MTIRNLSLVIFGTGALLLSSCAKQNTTMESDTTMSTAGTPAMSGVERGQYLVTIGGCNDCHTPMTMQNGQPTPMPNMLLAGHPETMPMPAAPKLAMPWMWAGGATFTSFSGPFGVTYAANLTPDSTGLGNWSEADFIAAMNTGTYHGKPILPPMPWPNIKAMTDDDKKALFAYLRSIPAVHNKVPENQLSPALGATMSKN